MSSYQTKETNVNIMPILYIYILGQKNMDVYVNNIYKKYKIEVYQRMKKSKYKNLEFIRNSNIERSIQFMKAVGIVEYLYDILSKESEKDLFDKMRKLIEDAINKVYPQVYKITKSGDVKKLKQIIKKSTEDVNKTIENMIVVMLLDFDMYEEEFNFLNDPKNPIYRLLHQWTADRLNYKEMYKNHMEKINSDREKYFPKNTFADIQSFLRYTLTDNEFKNTFEVSSSDLLDKLSSFFDMITMAYDCDYFQIEQSISISKIDLNHIFYAINALDIPEYLSPFFIWNGLIVMLLSKQIQIDKKLFFENNDEIIELEKKVIKLDDSKYKKENNDLKDRIKALESLIVEKDREIGRIRAGYKSTLEQEILQKEKDIEYLEDLLEEKIRVREYNSGTDSNIKNNLDNPPAVNIDGDLSYPKFVCDDLIYVVGGYPSLIRRLKEYFPNMVHVDNNVIEVRKYKDKRLHLLTNFTSHTISGVLDSVNADYCYISGIGCNQIAYYIKDMWDKWNKDR